MSYHSKTKDSFETRKRFYIFQKVVNGDHTISDESFLAFDVDKQEDIVKDYTTLYFHGKRDQPMAGHSCQLTVDEIYNQMKEMEKEHQTLWPSIFEKFRKEEFPKKLSQEKFDQLEKSDKCEYCELTLVEIHELISLHKIHKKNERSWKMEIDRKFPNQEYSDSNCVPACYWCNNAKTDEFTAEEFKPIGMAIGNALRKRMS